MFVMCFDVLHFAQGKLDPAQWWFARHLITSSLSVSVFPYRWPNWVASVCLPSVSLSVCLSVSQPQQHITTQTPLTLF